jgi:hypothetical protein
MPEDRRPKYTLFIVDKNNPKNKTKAGVLFDNGLGGFNLILGPGVTLQSSDHDRYYYNLWHIDWDAIGLRRRAVRELEDADLREEQDREGFGTDDSDIPF